MTGDRGSEPTRAQLGRVAAAHGGMSMRLWLAVFVAQGLWGLVTLLAVIGILVATWDTSRLADSDGLFDWLVDNADDVAGTSSGVLQATLYALATIGSLLLVGAFVVPLLIRAFVRLVCGARVGYGWALVANLASSVFLVALTLLLWFVPGGQPIAAFTCWLGSSLLTALIVQLRLRAGPTPSTTPVDFATPQHTTDREASAPWTPQR